jgi:hypothetical protein
MHGAPTQTLQQCNFVAQPILTCLSCSNRCNLSDHVCCCCCREDTFLLIRQVHLKHARFAFGLSATLTPKALELLFPQPPNPWLNFSSNWLTVIHKMTNDTWHYYMWQVTSCHAVTLSHCHAVTLFKFLHCHAVAPKRPKIQKRSNIAYVTSDKCPTVTLSHYSTVTPKRTKILKMLKLLTCDKWQMSHCHSQKPKSQKSLKMPKLFYSLMNEYLCYCDIVTLCDIFDGHLKDGWRHGMDTYFLLPFWLNFFYQSFPCVLLHAFKSLQPTSCWQTQTCRVGGWCWYT